MQPPSNGSSLLGASSPGGTELNCGRRITQAVAPDIGTWEGPPLLTQGELQIQRTVERLTCFPSENEETETGTGEEMCSLPSAHWFIPWINMVEVSQFFLAPEQ